MNQPLVRRIFLSEVIIWILFAALCVYSLYPLRKKIRLGIDLVGGSYLTLEVDTEKALEYDLISKLQALKTICKSAQLKQPIEQLIITNQLQITFPDVANAQKAITTLKKEWPDTLITSNNTVVTVTHTNAAKEKIKDEAVLRNIEVLRTRLDKFSVAEIPIARQGEKQITVELPDVRDPGQAKELIGRAAILEFRVVSKIAATEEDLLFELDNEIPYDKEILRGEGALGKNDFYLLEKYAQVTGRMLRSARASLGGQTGGEPVVEFEFDSEGSKKFYELTSKNIGKQLAIVLDNEVISAPRISVAISSNGQISGGFEPDQAKTLALLLKSGAFVAPVSFVEERQIGPSLGEAAIQSGVMSCLLGLLLLFLFSIVFYRISGFLAFLALIYNLIFLLAGLVWLQATLTLPGIAGIILTIGMAIDSAILVFEQIKDEIKLGIAPRIAMKKGFSDAMSVILDANITTFLVGVVLYHIGSGPVQGFAVTLMLGILATLIASLLFLRSMFNFWAKNSSFKKLSI